MKNYKFGFSLKGFISFMLVMFPNIIWMIIPPTNDVLAGNSASNPIYDIVLNASQWVMVATLIVLINKSAQNDKRVRILIGFAAFCLTGYYISWIFYYAGIVYPWLFVGMAVLPTLYFVFVELWMKNYIAIIPSVIFGITHVTITCSNYLR